MDIKELSKIILDQAREKGFGIKPEDIDVSEKIALIHSEISEAFEAYRKKEMNGKDGFSGELASAVIRIIHLAGIYNIDLEKEILDKIEFNKTREWDWDKLNEKHT